MVSEDVRHRSEESRRGNGSDIVRTIRRTAEFLWHVHLVRQSGIFDRAFYLARHPGLSQARIDPVKHYLRTGSIEGSTASPLFDDNYYRSRYEDVATSGVNPLVHYIRHGAKEGRDPHPLFDSRFYSSQISQPLKTTPLAHYLALGWREGLHPHPLFRSGYYLHQNPDVAQAGLNPLVDYVVRGAEAGCDPHPLFSTAYYLAQRPDAKAANPLVHYLQEGWRSGVTPHPLFDSSYYLSQPSKTVREVRNPLCDYLVQGWKEGRSPHLLFDVRYYLSQNPGTRGDPLVDYQTDGWRQGRNPHPLFDVRYFISQGPDTWLDEEPLVHYLLHGHREARSPHALFDNSFYLAQNPDVAASAMNPLMHFLMFGAGEGRDPNPYFDTTYYASRNSAEMEGKVNPLVHYIAVGASEGRDPNPAFRTSAYLQANPELVASGANPLVHYARKLQAFQLREAFRNELELSGKKYLDDEYHSHPIASVVIVALSRSAYLEDGILSSLLACSCPMEIIVVTSGSVEEAAARQIKELCDHYKCTLLSQSDGGPDALLEYGIAQARGAFIQLLDADDFLAPDKIDLQMEELCASPEMDICICADECSDEAGLRRWAPVVENSAESGAIALPFSFRRNQFGVSGPLHCALFRKEFLDGFMAKGRPETRVKQIPQILAVRRLRQAN